VIRCSHFVLAIAILVRAALAAPPATTQATQPSTAASVGPPAIDNVKEIQTILARAVEAGVSKADFDTLVTFLARPARDRMSEASTQKWPELDGRIDQFRKDWQAKYGQDFKLTDKPAVVFTEKNCGIELGPAEGEDASTTQLATTGPSTRKAAATKTATVRLPTTRGVAEVNLKLVNEGTLVPSWRFDLPSDVDGQRLHDQLLTHLTAFDEDKFNWPSDVNAAYELVADHVLAALAGTPVAATQPSATAPSTRDADR
jgi:hypothetical protein